jgi:hypothetical protein
MAYGISTMDDGPLVYCVMCDVCACLVPVLHIYGRASRVLVLQIYGRASASA